MLKFNERDNSFVLFTNDAKRAVSAGFTLSTSIRGPNGEKVYYTADYEGNPDFNPYAVLEFFDEADETASKHLEPLYRDYEASWSDVSHRNIAAPYDKEYMPYQKAGVAYALERGNCVIGDSPGLGKLSANHTPVLTPTGWHAIGDLSVGDMVATVDGTFTEVVGVFPQGMRRQYRVCFRDGTSTLCGAEHLWAVGSVLRRKRARLYGTSEFTVKTTQQLLDGGLRRFSNDGGLNAKWYVPTAEPIQHPTVELPIDPYVLGVLLGDGVLGWGNVEWATPDYDKDIVEYVATRLPSHLRVSKYEKSGCHYYGIVAAHGQPNPIRRALDYLGLRCNSLKKFVPDIYKFAGIEQRWDILRGLMDTDGSCQKNRTVFHSVSPTLAQDVADLVRSLGGFAVVREYDRSAEGKPVEYQVSIRVRECPFSVARKKNVWKRPSSNHGVTRYIVDIQDTGIDAESTCIKVAHPSSLYVTNDYIVTHNTIQAIGIANEIQAKKVLVVCPASIRRNWRREIFEWSTLPRATVQCVEKASHGIISDIDFTVVSYDLVRNPGIHRALRSVKWDLVIADEAHYLKTPTARRTRAMFGGGKRPTNPKEYSFLKNGLDRSADLIVAMTGTPLPNRPREAFTLARALNWEAIDYLFYDAFLYRYNPSMTIRRTDPKTGKDRLVNIEDKGRLAELNARLRCNLMVRRLKKDVLKQLPDKRYEMTYIQPDGAITKVLAKEALIDFDPHDMFNADFTLDGTPISTLRREMGEALVPRVVDYLKYLLDITEVPKIILFAHHKSVMLMLAEALDKYGVCVHRGGTSVATKEQAKADFMSGRPRIFIGQLDTMEGVDGLQSVCSDVVFAEPAWTPGRNEQCVDRAHRYGQHGNVVAHFLLVEGSFNERVLNVVLEKAEDIHHSLDSRVMT